MLQPSGIKDTIGAAGSVAAPGAAVVIATLPVGDDGIYNVELVTFQNGTPDALFTNMELRCGTRVICKLLSAAVAARTKVTRVTVLPGDSTITVNATAIGTGTYNASIQATEVG